LFSQKREMDDTDEADAGGRPRDALRASGGAAVASSALRACCKGWDVADDAGCDCDSERENSADSGVAIPAGLSSEKADGG
jgi:hypothetical protein